MQILNRCIDLDLGFPGPQEIFRSLLDEEIPALTSEIDYRIRGEPDPEIRRRYNNAIDLLQRELKLREPSRRMTKIRSLADEARKTGKETCDCGAHHPKKARFYVTATNGTKVLALSGPYKTHIEAMEKVDEAREKAISLDPGMHFASFGTTAMKSTYRKRGILDPL
jgi:hypothetical protein